MIHELNDRRFLAEASGSEFSTDGQHAGGRLEVKINAGSPAAWAAKALRELADKLEREAS